MIKTVSQVRVVNIKPHAYKPKFNQAELRQTIMREYTSANVGNDMQSAFAPVDAYKLPNNTYESERVCWVDVPKDWDLEQAQTHMESLQSRPDFQPCIYQVLSYEPILTSDDQAYLARLSDWERDNFIELKKNSQQLLNPSTGELVKRDNKQVYRKLFYSNTFKKDIDLAIARQVAATMVERTEPAEKVNAHAAVDF